MVCKLLLCLLRLLPVQRHSRSDAAGLLLLLLLLLGEAKLLALC